MHSNESDKLSERNHDSIWRSIRSRLYLFHIMFTMFCQLKLLYFVGTLADQLGRIFDNDKSSVSEYTGLFGYIQFGGLLVTPLIGLVFDREHYLPKRKVEIKMTAAEKRLKRIHSSILPFIITGALFILLSVLNLIENTAVQVPSYILYTITRGFLYADHGALIGIAFPASQFGTLYGFGLFIAGTFGIIQYALFELTTGPFQGNPFWTNIIMLCLLIVGLSHPAYLWWYCRKGIEAINRNFPSDIQEKAVQTIFSDTDICPTHQESDTIRRVKHRDPLPTTHRDVVLM